jgi:hypothetical protein
MARAAIGIALCLLLAVPFAALPADKPSPPAWHQLSAEQQRILAPIRSEWDGLDLQRKQKWIGIAKRYPQMSAAEQERLQRRMKEWVDLTPEQRRAAREKYREFEQLSPEERQAMRKKWEEYKQAQAAKEAAAREAAAREAAAADEAARQSAAPVESAAAAPDTPADSAGTAGSSSQ